MKIHTFNNKQLTLLILLKVCVLRRNMGISDNVESFRDLFFMANKQNCGL